MRKKIIGPNAPRQSSPGEWLDLENIASAEVTSEDPNFPLELALGDAEGNGWRASEKGKQTIRLIFDQPRNLRRIRLEFQESERERSQEFTLQWSDTPHGSFREIVRQQYNFSPPGTTREVEDYQVRLSNVSVLELTIKPELNGEDGIAALSQWRIA
jgi:hypothetical protein